ncbi:MAG: glutaredoxin family protein [Bacteroidetes bacterium]|nr:glutaredoxin family protein [Bacteroidota bacterium]
MSNLIQIHLISTQNCSLCDEALEQLKTLQRQTPFLIREEKILPGHPDFKLYKSQFPVVRIEGKTITSGRIDLSLVKHEVAP